MLALGQFAEVSFGSFFSVARMSVAGEGRTNLSAGVKPKYRNPATGGTWSGRGSDVNLVEGRSFMVRGGNEVDGAEIAPLDYQAVRDAALQIRAAGLAAVGITGVFSPLSASAEDAAAGIVREVCPGVAITLSRELGRIGLLARENATLLNASLAELARATTRAFSEALQRSGISAQLYITQNDGTVTEAAAAEMFPVLCFASGPTNSMRGAAYLSRLTDALVIDVGGTTSDVGCLQRGFPREANSVIEIGGVRTLFRMPDLISIGLGGGTVVDPADPTRIGPLSVGYRLPRDAVVFGGKALTCTDIGVAAGLIDLGDRSRVAGLKPEFVQKALGRMRAMMEEAIDRIKSNAASLPLIAVGGGSFLVPDGLPGISSVVRVQHYGVANALGAAIAQVSGEADQVFQNSTREDAIAAARKIAEERAVRNGADPATLALIEVEDLPLAYLPGNSLRVHVRVAGEIGRRASSRDQPGVSGGTQAERSP
jgi:N-methylhydantoinase A/oxoprolinase/acetone carboxylase beta subunit